MHVLYKITYLPHLGTNRPKYYIGSKYNYHRKYFGSVASKQIFPFTEGMSLKKWWKNQTTKQPNLFTFQIIMSFEDIDKQTLIEEEYKLQKQLDCVSNPDYFNQGFATKGFVSSIKTDETKKKMSESTKRYWNSIDGQKKKERLSERNKITKSEQQKKIWQENYDQMLTNFTKKGGRKKGIKNKVPGAGKRRNNLLTVSHNGTIYQNAYEAAKIHYSTNPHGEHYIRRMCRKNINGWKYEGCSNN